MLELVLDLDAEVFNADVAQVEVRTHWAALTLLRRRKSPLHEPTNLGLGIINVLEEHLVLAGITPGNAPPGLVLVRSVLGGHGSQNEAFACACAEKEKVAPPNCYLSTPHPLRIQK